LFLSFSDPEMRFGEGELWLAQAKWRFETLIRQKGLAQRLPPSPMDG